MPIATNDRDDALEALRAELGALRKRVGELGYPADVVVERTYDPLDWEAEALKETLRVLGEERFELKLGKAQAPVRVAVTGRTVGPPLFEGLVLLGRDETLRRLRAARARL